MHAIFEILGIVGFGLFGGILASFCKNIPQPYAFFIGVVSFALISTYFIFG